MPKPKKVNATSEKKVLVRSWKQYGKNKAVTDIIPAQLYMDAYYAGFMRGREVEKGITNGTLIDSN